MAIRRARLEDVDAIADAAASAWRWAYAGIVPDEVMARQQAGPLSERIRTNWTPDCLFLVSTSGEDQVVGFARDNAPPDLEGFEAEIGALYVHPDHARGGHGRLLVAAMADEFLRRGHRSLCIHTLKENRIGRSFYERLGGALVREDEWRGLPAVWYAWPDMSVLVGVGQ